MGRALLAAMLLAAWSGSAGALTITVQGGTGMNDAGDDLVFPYAATTFQALSSPPFSSGPVVAAIGSSSATTTYTFTHSDFLMEFSFARGGNANDGFARSQDFGALDFVLDAPAYATVSGAFDVTDTGAGDYVSFQALLQLQLTPLHHTLVTSRTTPNESFVVGQPGGDDFNQIEGPTTNLLLAADTEYSVQWLAWLLDDREDPGDTGATATGYLRIDFVELPEPSSGFLLAAALAALGMSRRRAGGGRRLLG